MMIKNIWQSNCNLLTCSSSIHIFQQRSEEKQTVLGCELREHVCGRLEETGVLQKDIEWLRKQKKVGRIKMQKRKREIVCQRNTGPTEKEAVHEFVLS